VYFIQIFSVRSARTNCIQYALIGPAKSTTTLFSINIPFGGINLARFRSDPKILSKIIFIIINLGVITLHFQRYGPSNALINYPYIANIRLSLSLRFESQYLVNQPREFSNEDINTEFYIRERKARLSSRIK
jgi:hypothetical protein